MEAIREMVERKPEKGRSVSEGGLRPSGETDRWPFDEPPDPEVPEKPKRRTFTAEYKARIVAEAERCKGPGEIGGRESGYDRVLSWKNGRSIASNTRARRKHHPPLHPILLRVRSRPF